jgi:hypothetical protein
VGHQLEDICKTLIKGNKKNFNKQFVSVNFAFEREREERGRRGERRERGEREERERRERGERVNMVT